MGAPLRLFFAVPVSEAVRETVVEVQKELRQTGAAVKWVERENVHFTLKFLGDTAEERIPALVETARGVAARTAPFEVKVQGLGYFPEGRRPQVIWAGCTVGGEEFAALGHDLDMALAAAGLAEADRRPFVPHLTLGRVRGGRNLRELAEALAANAERELGAMRVERFLLMQSELRREGPVYAEVGRFELGGRGLTPAAL